MVEDADDGIHRLLVNDIQVDMILGLDGFSLPVDVTVHTPKDGVYHCTFFSPDQIAAIMQAHAESGESLHGAYFWAADAIIVKQLDEQTLLSVVLDLWQSGELPTAMSRSDLDEEPVM